MQGEPVPDEKSIIRRVPPSGNMDFVVTRKDGSLRPTSAALFVREGEVGLSCSRSDVTTPESLLAQIEKSADVGWMVAVWKVKDLPEGLEVIDTPSDPPGLDPGHCEIRVKEGHRFTPKLRSKLAKAGAIVHPKPADSERAN